MNTSKTLLLAAVTALTLGVGSAMAQEGPSMPTIDYWAAQAIAARQAQVVSPNAVQSGSSDVAAPVHFDYSDLANPG